MSRGGTARAGARRSVPPSLARSRGRHTSPHGPTRISARPQVHRVLHNDTHYLRMIDEWREKGRAVLPRPAVGRPSGRRREDEAGERQVEHKLEHRALDRTELRAQHPWHCQWFQPNVLGLRARHLTWAPCEGIVGPETREWPWSRRRTVALGDEDDNKHFGV